MVRFYPIANIFRGDEPHCRYILVTLAANFLEKRVLAFPPDIFMRPALLTGLRSPRWRRSTFPVYAIYTINNGRGTQHILCLALRGLLTLASAYERGSSRTKKWTLGMFIIYRYFIRISCESLTINFQYYADNWLYRSCHASLRARILEVFNSLFNPFKCIIIYVYKYVNPIIWYLF